MRLFSKHVDHRLSEYLDRRLAPGEIARVEEHLADCAACREQLEGLRAAIAAIQTLPEVDVPRSFAVNEAMVRPIEASGTSRWQPYAAPAAGLAVVFVLLLGGDLATSIDSEDDADVAEDASQELLQMDELASEQAAGAERSEAEAPAGEEESAPADADQSDGEFTEESTEEEQTEEELVPLADEDGDDSTTSEADDSAPATPDPETIEQLENVDEDDDDFRLFVRLIEAALAAGALLLGFLAFRRWRASR